ncbi:Fcf2-domain-containing protein [Jaminaea rosea]|uniref:Fcf2-domain-containing protein n=1 Tax=Jaminaea rosea TaxID=1569628 RepID=A0A316UIM7_9BASI|nr:Fcf2-domain-containing protein [Jaminaea rosea]PWN24764.1 Fcf2-domain-containing protein [Jaminaea rosea]
MARRAPAAAKASAPAESTSRASSVASSSSSSSDGEEDLDALFQASIQAYTSMPAGEKDRQDFAEDDDVILLDGNDTEKRSRAIRDDATPRKPSKLPAASDTKGKGKAVDSQLDKLSSRDSLAELRPVGQRAMIKRRQEERAKTAGSSWYDMPAFPTDPKAGPSTSASSRYSSSARGPTAEEMRREVQAIRLRNALDPKRFYKGGNKDKGMPKYAQLGRIISSPLEPRQTLSKAERGRTVVEELVKDAQASAYAKRKYGEHQVKAASGGRGHSKAKTRKPNDRSKRQRR